MLGKIIIHIIFPALIAGLVLGLIKVVQVLSGNIDPTHKYAWSATTGWINFNPDYGGVTVYDDHLEGYAWAENIGWIRLGSHNGGGSYTYGNSSTTDYGVNRDNDGHLSGYAWSASAGWINFDPPGEGVSIDPDTGHWAGYAWGENTGWIHFEHEGTISYGVVARPAPANCTTALTTATIIGANTGQTDTGYAFTTIINPTSASNPITYTWSPAPLAGQGTSVATYTWRSPGQQVITITLANCGPEIVTDSWTITLSAPPAPSAGDTYEDDDSCSTATAITTDSIPQRHTFHDISDTDWIKLPVMAGKSYLIEARVPPTATADIDLQLYESCSDESPNGQYNTFSTDVRYILDAPNSGHYYLRLRNNDETIYGPNVAYQLSVRQIEAMADKGAVIIVAGLRREDDPLQDNIYHVTDAIYTLARNNGCTADDIYYLANDSTLRGVDAPATSATLEMAITTWAKEKVGPDKPLTLYLMDHGGPDKFYLNGSAETVTPADLNAWLTNLENEKGTEVSVVMEACNSGSFITAPQQISRLGRVVIASTGAADLAYASAEGAIFSDAFLEALKQGASLPAAFAEGQWMAEATNPDQHPQLESNGNSTPNEPNDSEQIAQRGFACAAAPNISQWPPTIERVTLKILSDGNLGIWATVHDDRKVAQVWAIVYPPSYRPLTGSEELVQTDIPPVQLTSTNADTIYGGLYPPLTEQGVYRVVVYARDDEGLIARPTEVMIGEAFKGIYLPLVMK